MVLPFPIDLKCTHSEILYVTCAFYAVSVLIGPVCYDRTPTLPNSNAEILTLNTMVLGGGALGGVDHESGAPEGCRLPSTWRHSKKMVSIK